MKAAKMNTTLWLGAFLIGLGLIFVQFAFAGWSTGNPAPVSLFAPRETVRVVSAEVLSGRQNGSIRHIPRVTVLHRTEIATLGGLTGSFYDNRRGSAEASIEDYAIGKAVTVRLLNDAPYADRTDWFLLGSAIWMTFFAGGVLSVGVLLVVACFNWRRSRRDP